jgi:hypothetical protein
MGVTGSFSEVRVEMGNSCLPKKKPARSDLAGFYNDVLSG